MSLPMRVEEVQKVATPGGIHSVTGSRGENSKGGVLSHEWHFSCCRKCGRALLPAQLSMLQGGVQIRNDIFLECAHLGKTRSLEGLLQLVRGECRGHWRVATNVSFQKVQLRPKEVCATSFGPSMGSCAVRQDTAAGVPLRGVAGHAVCNRSRCAREARDGRAGAAVLGGRRHCNGRQEPFPGRQLVLRRAAGAAAEPLWRVSGDASPCGRSRAGWKCSRRRGSG